MQTINLYLNATKFAAPLSGTTQRPDKRLAAIALSNKTNWLLELLIEKKKKQVIYSNKDLSKRSVDSTSYNYLVVLSW